MSFWKDSETQDYADLAPPITYRHLLSHNLGVRDPLRVIALCDSDAFYAACEMVRLGSDPAIPLVVQQWDSLIAVNYAARKYGISRMDKARDAKKKCPELVCVHVATYKEGDQEPAYWGEVDNKTHKVSLDHYRRESAKILAMFKARLPKAELEKASIDEAFFDLTHPVREILLQRFPHLANIPPEGVDSLLPPPPCVSWRGLGYLIPINEQQGNPNAHDETIDQMHAIRESASDVNFQGPAASTWHDVALSIGAELMNRVRDDIRTKLGYTTSAGIARNKFLAKLGASYKKPNSQSILRNAAIPSYLRPIAFQKIRWLGGKLGKAIAEEYDVRTVGDLLSVGVAEFQTKFGEEAIWVWEALRGIDKSEVKAKPVLTKTMNASKNLPQPVTRVAEGKHWIRVLAAELALRLRDARQDEPTLWPRTIVFSARKGYDGPGRSKQAPFPFTKEISVDVVAAAGEKLWREFVGAGLDDHPLPTKITHMHLGFSGIETAGERQGSIEGFLRSPDNESDSRSAKRLRIPSDGDDIDADGKPKSMRKTPGHSFGYIPASASRPSFICDRCGKRISLSASIDDSDNLGVGNPLEAAGRFHGSGSSEEHLREEMREEVVRAGLDKLKMEHEDFHFAQDLARSTSGKGKARLGITPDDPPSTVGGTNAVAPAANAKKRQNVSKDKGKGTRGGIEKFFSRS